jgi:hypothetical protein
MLERLRTIPKNRFRAWLVGSEDMPPYLLLSFLILVYLVGVFIRFITSA